jgi:hypothetical protein
MRFGSGTHVVVYSRAAVRVFVLIGAVLAALATASLAAAAPGSQVGIYDEASTLYSNDTSGFDMLQELGTDILRLNMYWDRVARTRPANAADPADPAYDWTGYDRAARLAAERNIEVLFSIIATPGWANGGKGAKYAPTSSSALRDFAIAAATRYSGEYTPPGQASPLPLVNKWLAWNEPNAPNFLLPQFRKVGRKYVIASPAIYARICNAVVQGVHTGGSRAGVKMTVACGATNPRGKLRGNGRRDSVAPLLFLREMKKAGARFDRYSHHPYSPTGHLAPNQRIRSITVVPLGNIDILLRELTRLYGRSMRLWITEYAYQTNPPDPNFGVSWATQAKYLRQAYAIARRTPRVDMMLWFLLKDEQDRGRWNSGLLTASGERKPSFAAFQDVADG